VLAEDVYVLEALDERGRPLRREVPMRNALNEVLRDWYVGDCRSGIDRWNRKIASHGIDFQFALPDRKFNRQIGVFAGLRFDPSGRPIGEEAWQRRRTGWLPTAADTEYLKNVQATAIYEAGRFANYIAPPLRGINQKPIGFEYVRTET
jgi:benzoyl-CoA 2,3-dioxygenase component B